MSTGRYLVALAILMAWLGVPSAHAQVLPPPVCPPICPPGGGGGAVPATDATDHGGNRWKFGTEAWLYLEAALAGDAILYKGHAKPLDFLEWNLGSITGPVGGGAALALFQEEQGLFVKFFRPGGFTCQVADAGRVPGCDWWLDERRQHAIIHHRRHHM
jgi:hypothetical protein